MGGDLGNRVAKEAPYRDTPVPYSKTKTQIEDLLKSYGVKGVGWISTWTVKDGQNDVLQFMADVNVRGVKKTVTISVKPPHIYIKKTAAKGGRGGLVTAEDPNQEYRLLFYWIKSKIEAITWGLTTIEQEFLAEITTALPDGRNVTVGEVVQELIAEDRLPSLEYFGGPVRQADRPNMRNITPPKSST